MQGLGYLERLDLAGWPVHGAFLGEQAAVEQHPHRLDRVERHSLGAREDLVAQALRQSRHEPFEQVLHRLARERLQVERGEVALAGAPARPAFLQLRPRERDYVERIVARPLEQRLDEVEQARVRPLHVLEGEHGREDVGQPLEEEPPGGKEVRRSPVAAPSSPSSCASRGLHEGALLRLGEVLLERRRKLLARRVRRLVLADPAAHPHHVGERPVGHALPVGQAAAAMPVHLLDDPVEVLVELPREPRLADARDAGHGDEVRASLLGAAVEELLAELQLPLAADERRLQPLRFQLPAQAGDDPQRPPQRDRLRLSLQLVLAGTLVDDCLLGRAPGRLPGEHGPRLRRRLDPRGCVDEIAGDHPLALGADRHRGLPRQHAGARLQRRIEIRDRGDQLERCADGPLAVGLGRDGRPPDRHHCIADELLDRAAVPGDERAREVEVAGQQLARVFGVSSFRCGREPHEVDEEDGNEAPLRGRRSPGRGWVSVDGRRLGVERRTTLPAKLLPRQVRGAARRARRREGNPAFAAELLAGRVLGAAVRARGHMPNLDRSGPKVASVASVAR